MERGCAYARVPVTVMRPMPGRIPKSENSPTAGRLPESRSAPHDLPVTTYKPFLYRHPRSCNRLCLDEWPSACAGGHVDGREILAEQLSIPWVFGPQRSFRRNSLAVMGRCQAVHRMSKAPQASASRRSSAALRIACRTAGADTSGIMRAVSAAKSAAPWARIAAQTIDNSWVLAARARAGSS